MGRKKKEVHRGEFKVKNGKIYRPDSTEVIEGDKEYEFFVKAQKANKYPLIDGVYDIHYNKLRLLRGTLKRGDFIVRQGEVVKVTDILGEQAIIDGEGHIITGGFGAVQVRRG